MSRLASFVRNLKAWDSDYTVTPHVRERNSARVLAAVGRAHHEEDGSFRVWYTWKTDNNVPNLTQSRKALKRRVWEVLDEPT